MGINIGSLDILSAHAGAKEIEEVYVGSTKVWPDSPGVVYAGNFDGANIYGVIPHSAEFNVDYVEVEIKFKINTAGRYHGLFSLNGNYNGATGVYFYIGQDNTIRVRWSEGGSAVTHSFDSDASAGVDYTANFKLYEGTGHIVLVLNGTTDGNPGTLNAPIHHEGSEISHVGVLYEDTYFDGFMDGIIYDISAWGLDSLGNRVTDGYLYGNDFQNGPDGDSEPNDADNAPSGTDMTWEGVPSPGDQYVEV